MPQHFFLIALVNVQNHAINAIDKDERPSVMVEPFLSGIVEMWFWVSQFGEYDCSIGRSIIKEFNKLLP